MMTEVAITQPQSFEDRLKARVKDSIGELMTDEELAVLVKKSVDSIFFIERTMKRGWENVTLPPLLHEIVKDCINERVTLEIRRYVDTHGDEVNKIIGEKIQEGMGAAMISAVKNTFAFDLGNFAQAMEQRLIQNRQV